ncbi:MAG: nucleoside triphosphate pyrophosphohydrolase [Hyphomonadaceae bacterium]|nr:nucleoside triphosphate pyrophosphohydrolase [Clostridia bacterium]
MSDKKYTFDDLVDILAKLRGENGCPWDRVQTHESLKRYFIEETYEALEALDSGDSGKFADELGDVLLQIVFHAQIAKDAGTFTTDDVLRCICQKMIDRHPHVFGNVQVNTPEQVVSNWDEIKKREKGQSSHGEVLADISRYLPSLMRASKVIQKEQKTGKLTKEIEQVHNAIQAQASKGQNVDIGGLLFEVVKLANITNQHPELALTEFVDRYIEGVRHAEN